MIRSFAFSLLILSVCSVTGQIANRDDWEQAYREIARSGELLLALTEAKEQGRLALEASYWLRAYVSMAETFRDTLYLNRSVRLIDFLFDNRDDERQKRGEIDLNNSPY